jgi:hypothetical protein
MPQVYTGTLITNEVNKLTDVKVIIKAEGKILGEAITNNEGKFNIILPTSVTPADTTVTFSKNGFTLYTLKNAQPTSEFVDSFSDINPLFGGKLDLKGQFAGGKYFITSLSQTTQDRLFWETYNIVEFVKKNPQNYTVKIIASESTITNYDREEFLEDGTTPNSNWAGPLKTFNTSPLPTKALSEKRFNSLKKYVENFFNSYGVKLETPIKADIRVGNDTESSQFVQLTVSLRQATCSDIDLSFGRSQKNDILIPKPPNAKTITVNALLFPDRFGIDNRYNNYFSQQPDSPGSSISWGYIAFLSLYGNRDNFKDLKDGSFFDLPLQIISKKEVRKALETDLKLETQKIGTILRVNIVQFLQNQQKTKTAKDLFIKYNKDDKGLLDEELLNLLFEYADANIVQYTRIAPIKQELTTFSIADKNEEFVLNQMQGVLTGNSEFKINLCNK